MGRKCVVCGVLQQSGKLLFRFPKNLEKRRQWLGAVNIDEENLSTSHVVCEDHFAPESWEKVRVDGERKLKTSAVPQQVTRAENVSARAPLKDVSNDILKNGNQGDHTYMKHRKLTTTQGKKRLKCHSARASSVISDSQNVPPDVYYDQLFAEDSTASTGKSDSERGAPDIEAVLGLLELQGVSVVVPNDSSPPEAASPNLMNVGKFSEVSVPTVDCDSAEPLLPTKSPTSTVKEPSNVSGDPTVILSDHAYSEMDIVSSNPVEYSPEFSIPNATVDCDSAEPLLPTESPTSSVKEPTNVSGEPTVISSDHAYSKMDNVCSNPVEYSAQFPIPDATVDCDEEPLLPTELPLPTAYSVSAEATGKSPDVSISEFVSGLSAVERLPCGSLSSAKTVDSPNVLYESRETGSPPEIPVYRLSGDIRTLEDIRRLQEENRRLRAAAIEMENKTEQTRKLAERIFQQNIRLKTRYSHFKTELKRLQHSSQQKLAKLRSRLREDQVIALGRRSTRGLKWSSASYKEGFIFKMKWGTQGYSDFLKKYPLFPSARALQECVKGMRFDSGILEEVFAMVEPEVPNMVEQSRRCAIFMDEMAIKEGDVWDPSVKRLIGRTTFAPHKGLAKKALVVMIAHLTTRQKYAVAYYFTSSAGKKDEPATNEVGEALRDLVFSVIRRGEGIGLLIDAVINDMGPDNQALWRAVGITSGTRKGQPVVSISHPVRPSDRLWFMPDPIHLTKNVFCILSSNKIIHLSDDVVPEEKLDEDEVRIQDLEDLVTFEQHFELKVAHRLKMDTLDGTNQFNKMKVGTTRSVFNKRTEVGLKLHAEQTGTKNGATVFLVGLVNEWFDVVTNRGQKMALRKADMDAYHKSLHVLRKMLKVFRGMKIGKKGAWKPVQTGIIIACECLLEIQAFLLEQCGFSYVILGRFLQDCIENLFSLIRFRQAVPNALQFKDNLKVITLSKLCLTSNKTGYLIDCEDTEVNKLQTDFLHLCKRLTASKEAEEELPSLLEASQMTVPEVRDEHLSIIDSHECAVFYDFAGAVLRSLRNINVKLCETCIGSLLWHGEGHHPFSVVVQLRKYKDNALTEVSDDCFKALLKAEISFRLMREALATVQHLDILDFMASSLEYVWNGCNIPACHGISRRLLERFLTMRFKMYGLQRRQHLSAKKVGVKEYSSKSMAMRAAVSK